MTQGNKNNSLFDVLVMLVLFGCCAAGLSEGIFQWAFPPRNHWTDMHDKVYSFVMFLIALWSVIIGYYFLRSAQKAREEAHLNLSNVAILLIGIAVMAITTALFLILFRPDPAWGFVRFLCYFLLGLFGGIGAGTAAVFIVNLVRMPQKKDGG